MTVDEFQEKYHNYCTKNKLEAVRECEIVNNQIVGAEVVVADLGGLGCCLMLKTAYDAVKDIL